MLRFYSGLSLEDINAMPLDQYYGLWQAITVIEAQEMLIQMTISDYPKMKKEDRSKLHRRVVKKAYPDEEKKAISASDMKSILSAQGFM